MKKSTYMCLFLAALFAISLASCSTDESELVNVEALTDGSIERLQAGAFGKNHCLELIFPISITFTDETTATVADYEELYTTVAAWFEANEVENIKENKPELVFPIQVLTEDGEIVDVASSEELKELKSDCPKSGKCKGKRGKGFSCFELVFPITVSIGGEETLFEDKSTLKAAVRAYKETAGDEAEKPSLVFPVTVLYEDGTEAVAASQEELQALKEACQDEEG